MSDAEWAVTEVTLPAPAWKQGRGGRPARHCRRDVADAIRYLVKEGDDPGRGFARSGQPSFTAVPEALTISMLLPAVS